MPRTPRTPPWWAWGPLWCTCFVLLLGSLPGAHGVRLKQHLVLQAHHESGVGVEQHRPPPPDVSRLELPAALRRPGYTAQIEPFLLKGLPLTTRLRLVPGTPGGGEYTAEVWLGTPAQRLNLTLDTGKTLSWVVAEGCVTESLARLTSFRPRASSTWQPEPGWAQVVVSHDKLEIPEDDERDADEQHADVLARRGLDTLQLGFDLSIERFQIGVGTTAEGTFPDKFKHAGVIGLGFRADLPRRMRGPAYVGLAEGWSQLVTPQSLSGQARRDGHRPPAPLVGFYLDPEGVDGGCVQWGRHEPPVYYRPGSLRWFPAEHSVTSWTLRIQDILVDGRSLGFCGGPQGCGGAVQSGSGLITGPPEQMMRLLRQIQVDPMCQDVGLLPPLTFVLAGGHRVELRGEQLAGRQPNPDDPEGGDQCLGVLALQQVDAFPAASRMWILGTPFMRRVYTVFDLAGSRVGLAEPERSHFLLNRCDYSDWGLRIGGWVRDKPVVSALAEAEASADAVPGPAEPAGLLQSGLVTPLDAQLRSGILKILDAADPVDRIALAELRGDSSSLADPAALLEAVAASRSDSVARPEAEPRRTWVSERRGAGLGARVMAQIDRQIREAERAMRPYADLQAKHFPAAGAARPQDGNERRQDQGGPL